MEFGGVTPALAADLRQIASDRMLNDAGINANIAAKQEVVNQTTAQAGRINLSEDQLDAIKDAGGFDGDVFNTKGMKIQKRMHEQNRILEGLNGETKRELIKKATRADVRDALKMFASPDSSGSKSLQPQYAGLSGKLAGTYGSKYGDEFVLNADGLENLETEVATYKKAVTARKAAADLATVKEEGHVVKSFSLSLIHI